MSYNVILICGASVTERKNLDVEEKKNLQEVECPCCLEAMYLSINQLKAIYIHNYIESINNELEVLCNECASYDLERFSSSLYNDKIKILSVEMA